MDLPERMRAVVLTAPNAHEVRDIPTPRPGPLEVLCKVDSVAICGTDLHIYEGKFPGRWPKGYPFTPGSASARELLRDPNLDLFR